MAVFTFGKAERLKKKKQIERLFSSGKSFFIYPFKVIWLTAETDGPYPAQVMISVSKRAMKRAVDRNRMKRQVREVYRHTKSELYQHLEENNQQALIGIIFTGHDRISFEDTQEKIKLVMSRLLREMRKHPDH